MKPLLIEKAENLYQKYIDKTLPKNIRKHCVNFEEANKVHDRWVERENIYKKDISRTTKKISLKTSVDKNSYYNSCTSTRYYYITKAQDCRPVLFYIF